MKRLVATADMGQRVIQQGHDWALVEESAEPGDVIALFVLREGANHSKQYSGQVIEVTVTECKPEFNNSFGLEYTFLKTYQDETTV